MSDFALVRGRRLRVTKTDGCGRVVLGPDSRVVTKGFISVTLTPNNTTTDAISVTNAAGEECVREEGSSAFANWGVAGSFCGVMPELFSMMTGQPVVRDAAGLEAIGIRQNSKVDVELVGFAMEVWSKIPGGACDESGNPEWGYMVLPFIKGGTLGGVTFENGAINFSIENATTRDGNEWGAGPYDVELDETGAPGPLNEPLDPFDHSSLQRVNVDPPEETDGADALGTEATGATAGIPATLTPTNSYAPDDLTDAATGFTASPSTAWTTGQYVTLRDGTKAHWNGTAWVAGPA